MKTIPFTNEMINDAAEIYYLTFNEEPWYESWTHEIAFKRISDIYNTPNFAGLALYEDTMIGFCLGNKELYYNGEIFNLQEMCIKKSKERQGAGSLLLRDLMALINSNSLSGVYAITLRNSYPEKFYYKNDFIESQEMMILSKKL